MFISALELFKIGIGPSSSHTVGPMAAANAFMTKLSDVCSDIISIPNDFFIRCTLKGSLAFTGKGHATDRAILLGLHGYRPHQLVGCDVKALYDSLKTEDTLSLNPETRLGFQLDEHLIFDYGEPLAEHPNGMIFELVSPDNKVLFSETYFSIGGGFISTLSDIDKLVAPLKIGTRASSPYPFDSAKAMLQMAHDSQNTIAEMKRQNELAHLSHGALETGLDKVWQAMKHCIKSGLACEGVLPGGLNVHRRARQLYQQLLSSQESANVNDWLCAYAMAVNEENAAGHMVVTAPTNGAAGVIPAVLYYFVTHENGSLKQIHEFLLTASAIGGLIKHLSSISGAEVGCQGEVGSAAAMAAAGLCAVKGGTPEQIENAAEIALEHHLGMTCDPVKGLVQVPCIERNGFGAIKAYTAASLALRGSGQHIMHLDNCIAAMKQTGEEMSHKFKETSLGGLAVSITEC
ncbi:MAG: L-serine ammonia-lyase [Hydrogenovibrio sp.]|nr:L-serine ammonia-lyase [Hydrogenovibrio sp.]